MTIPTDIKQREPMTDETVSEAEWRRRMVSYRLRRANGGRRRVSLAVSRRHGC